MAKNKTKKDKQNLEAERLEGFMDVGDGIPKPSEPEPSKEQPLHPSHVPVPNTSNAPEESKERDIHNNYDIIKDADKRKHWSDNPSYPDQYTSYPETVRTVGPTVEVFDLDEKEDLHRFNKYMAGQQSTSAPRSYIHIMDKQWDDKKSNWKILAQVTKFKYLKILEKE